MIRAHVTDRAAPTSRPPSELAMHLRAKEWVVRDRDRNAVSWVKPADDDEFEALQPLDSGLRDDPSRVGDLLTVAAIAEGRSELEVLDDIASVLMDVHSVRAISRRAGAGADRFGRWCPGVREHARSDGVGGLCGQRGAAEGGASGS
ncbi:hypothetical protein [Actinoplanes sp. G11-F43]|uniref:hypothetical protein n=1 Tax=Actinoplanes sp. G11-F43 TaxID=3424130 RepID=UPI003D359A64